MTIKLLTIARPYYCWREVRSCPVSNTMLYS